MAKTVRKIQPAKNNQKKRKGCITKECSVKLHKMSESFIRRWLKPNTFSINIGIKNNRLQANNVEISSVSPSVFNIDVRIKHGNLLINEQNFRAADTSPVSIIPVQKQPVQHIEKTLIQLVNESWAETLREHKKSKFILKENDIIMGKMKGYSPWPGKIISFTKNRKRAQIYFYGTHNTGGVHVNEMAPYDNSRGVIRLQLLRILLGFTKGILEVETETNIPREFSMTNKVEALK